jgi:hypothetical protein
LKAIRKGRRCAGLESSKEEKNGVAEEYAKEIVFLRETKHKHALKYCASYNCSLVLLWLHLYFDVYNLIV